VGARRSLVVLLCVAACAGKTPARADAGAGTPSPVAVPPPPPPRPTATAPDAPASAEEPQTPPIHPADVLSGPAAEQAIGESPPPPETPRDPDAPSLLITPLGVGPFALGLPRQALVQRLSKRAELAKTRTAPGDPTIEVADLSENGVHLLHLVVYAGRLIEVTVSARDHRAVTAAEIGVGSTFDDAELAHGDPRKVGRGWVLSALPGVVFAPADPAVLGAPTPPPEAIVGRIIVVGPESD
jgi:hypothetical protein